MGDATPLLIALPLAGAALGRVPALARVRGLDDAITIATCGAVTAIALVLLPSVTAEPALHWIGGWEPRDGLVIAVPLVADTASIGMVALAGGLMTATAVYVIGDYERLGGLFHVLSLLLLAAVNGFLLSGDLLTMFVFVELLGISTYALTAYKVNDVGTVPAAFNIAVTSTIGAAIFLTGVTMVYATVGSPSLAQVHAHLADGTGATPSLVVAAGLLIAGLSAKAGLLPFHFSHADSHTAAMVPHAALFGAIVVPAGLYGITRLFTTAIGPMPGVVVPARTLLLSVGLATALVGAAMSLVQGHLKRLLAFSSIAHLGIATVGIAVGSATAMAGSMLYIVGHGLLKVGLFLAAGALLHRMGTVEVARLAGRWRECPGGVVVLAVGAPLLAGAVPGGLHLGKAGIDAGASDAGLGWVMVPVYLAAILTGAAVARGVVHLVAGWPAGPDDVAAVAEGERETTRSPTSTPMLLVAVPVALVGLSMALPFAPAIGSGAMRGAAMLLDGPAYTRLGLDGVAPAVAAVPWPGTFGTESLVKGVVAGIGAVALGIAAAHDRPGTGRGRAGLPLVQLRRLHSGHVGDYVAWAAGGAAVWATVLLVAAG